MDLLKSEFIDQTYNNIVEIDEDIELDQFDEIAETILEKKITGRSLMTVIFGLIIFYLLIGQILGFLQYISEIIIFTIMPIKIAIHIFSSNEDLKKFPKTDDHREQKNQYLCAKKLNRVRLDYTGVLLRQIFIVQSIKFMIQLLPFIGAIPIISIITPYIHLMLLVLALFVQIPVSMLNHIMSRITDKMKLFGYELRSNYLLSDKIVLAVKRNIGEQKLVALREIRDVTIKCDEGIGFDETDKKNVISSLDCLGININGDYLANVNFNPDDYKFFRDFKTKSIRLAKKYLSDRNMDKFIEIIKKYG
jgi:hypothetical protein